MVELNCVHNILIIKLKKNLTTQMYNCIKCNATFTKEEIKHSILNSNPFLKGLDPDLLDVDDYMKIK